ncbi:ceramidase domain-containing protein [Cognatishimia sp. SS12]|uniref:ceramidase domain-containing protein n=1 Tax=Cognatishimia sp. SS12 TaxID=2979465 RepID=UPI00232B28BB|nr:ceramidase domain-containing protein [Cognatishimia sp. SS12]MDC0738631.1 ceramidase domain-containing protein [Cognatishimia sp. SS12]
MNWTQQVDGYCERLDPSFWAEPVNAITNLAFVIAALIMWQRSAGLPLARLLSAILMAIGIGSFLFHTFAQTWASMADTLPIVLFILTYIFAATRDYWGLSAAKSGFVTLLFFPYAALLVPAFGALPFFEISAAYWPVPLLIFVYAFGLRRRIPRTARNLAIGAGVICLSLTFRSLDMPLCAQLPLGTHFMWHLLNGLALGWMIETYRVHMLAPPHKQG